MGGRQRPITLTLAARATALFNSHDLEHGNPAKGLSHGIGAGADGRQRVACRPLQYAHLARGAAGTTTPISAAPPTGGSDDMELGTDLMGLRVVRTSESVWWTAPSTAATYYYGACVDAVATESDGASLVLTFHGALAAAANLANSAFAVERTPSEPVVTLTGFPSINGGTVTLTLDPAHPQQGVGRGARQGVPRQYVGPPGAVRIDSPADPVLLVGVPGSLAEGTALTPTEKPVAFICCLLALLIVCSGVMGQPAWADAGTSENAGRDIESSPDEWVASDGWQQRWARPPSSHRQSRPVPQPTYGTRCGNPTTGTAGCVLPIPAPMGARCWCPNAHGQAALGGIIIRWPP